MKKKTAVLCALALAFCGLMSGCGDPPAEKDVSLWDFAALSAVVPQTEDAGYTYAQDENIKALYFTGAAYHGEQTRVFAYMGTPSTPKPAAGYPAVVLVHGGLGRAFPDWVKLWTDRGYAAIALSVDANSTDANNTSGARNEQGGPNISITPQDMRDPENSWIYISVANIIACHNLLRAREDVDANNIGITGISWGSYLMNIAVGVDTRFRFGIPVYGAGYNHEDVTSSIGEVFALDDESLAIYAERFDPAVYVKRANLPMLWVAGANDHAFSLACNQKSADGNKGKNTYSWREKLTHGQQPGDGSGIPEIFAFADSVVKGEDTLLRSDGGNVADGTVTLTLENDAGVVSAALYWSAYPLEYWHDSSNVWERAEVTVSGKTVTAAVPDGAVYGFIAVTDENGYQTSSRCFAF